MNKCFWCNSKSGDKIIGKNNDWRDVNNKKVFICKKCQKMFDEESKMMMEVKRGNRFMDRRFDLNNFLIIMHGFIILFLIVIVPFVVGKTFPIMGSQVCFYICTEMHPILFWLQGIIVLCLGLFFSLFVVLFLFLFYDLFDFIFPKVKKKSSKTERGN